MEERNAYQLCHDIPYQKKYRLFGYMTEQEAIDIVIASLREEGDACGVGGTNDYGQRLISFWHQQPSKKHHDVYVNYEPIATIYNETPIRGSH